ncbi:MAG: hypothetical protein KBE04_09005 [Phycisphaerae bacterium]|nr:hypothetical protein [Phycisphaerae bacterium]
MSTFEGTLEGWWQDAATITVGATGATAGSQAMQVDAAGGWKLAAKFNAKFVRDPLSHKGAKITADVTAFEADMTSTWMQVGMVVNGQNNDDNGPHNNIGWQDLGLKDALRDGQPHTLSWELPEALTDKIAGVTEDISWFELCLISNVDGASVTKFYVDNIQISYPDTTSVLVSDFEDGFDGWGSQDGWRVGILSLGATGATEGAQAMQVEGPGGWQQMAKIDLKPYGAALANQGASIAADVTAFPADMTTAWMQVEMIFNGAAPVGWSGLGGQGVTLDGQPHTVTWAVPDDMVAKIAEGVEALSYFELVLVSNMDSASTAKFYIDNIRITGVPATPTDVPKSTDLVIGNWELDLDGWVANGADANYSDTNGVTLDGHSLSVYVETGAWNQGLLTLDLLDPNNAAILAAFKANTKITVDVTRIVADWPTPPDLGVQNLDWDEILLIIDAGGEGWGMDWDAMTGTGNWSKQANWLPRNGRDETIRATWDYSRFLPQMNFDNMTWCRIQIGINANDSDYTGWVKFYLDNMKLSGGGVAIGPQPANRARDVDPRTMLRWSGGAYAQSFNVYLGLDADEVLAASGATNPAVTFATVDANSFDPSGLEFNTQYFWRVDAVNDVNPDSPWTGPVWSFTTAKFVVVDDFETYTNYSPNRVFQTWRDGAGFSADEFFPKYEGNGTGSIVGFDPSWGNIMETENAHSGQAMPMDYDNKELKISEAVRTWAEPQNWTSYEYLTVWVRGLAENGADRLYLKLKDGAGAAETEAHPEAAILNNLEWTEWKVPMSDFAAVNLAAITEMTIGVGDSASPKASSGRLFVDDIRLYPLPLVFLDPDHLVVGRASAAPVIDGVGNGVWADVTAIPMLITEMTNTASAAPENAADLSASFKALYDDTNFYLFVDIQDSLVDLTFSDYQGDGIEVYFDGDYSHGDRYDGINDNQIRITAGDIQLADINSSLPIEGTQFKVLRTAGGYAIEAAFPLSALQIYPSADPAPVLDAGGNPIPGTGIAPNNVIGFEMQINDDDGGGRQTLMRWYSDDNNSYQNPGLFGQARLVGTN